MSAERVDRQGALTPEDLREQVVGAFPLDARGAATILDIQPLLHRVFPQRSERKFKAVAPARRERADAGPETTELDRLVTFDVANQAYALPLSTVQEVMIAPAHVTEVPRTDALVLGLVPHRNQVLPLLSLRGLLGLAPASDSDRREHVLVTLVRGVAVGLVVDRARAIVSAERRLTEPIPALLAARSGGETQLAAVYRGEEGRRLISILAPDQLFRENVMQRLSSVERPSAPKPAAAATRDRQFVVFRLDEDEFALPVEAVDEVGRVPDRIARVPKTPEFLEGVVNLRGEILPVVDQRRRFNMPPFEGVGRRLIVARSDGHRAGLIVDSVREVRRCSEDAIGPAPELTGDIARLVQSVINLVEQSRIVLVLNPAELLTRAEHGLLDAFERKVKAGK